MTMTTPALHLMLTDIDQKRLEKTVKDLRAIGGPYVAAAARLESALSRAKICTKEGVAPEVVTMNSQVRVIDLRSHEKSEFTVTYPTEADILDDRISVISPLGLALLGKTAGEVVEIHVPAGIRKFRIERVLYQPEAAGDDHL